jgi:hypothetical protein
VDPQQRACRDSARIDPWVLGWIYLGDEVGAVSE